MNSEVIMRFASKVCFVLAATALLALPPRMGPGQ